MESEGGADREGLKGKVKESGLLGCDGSGSAPEGRGEVADPYFDDVGIGTDP